MRADLEQRLRFCRTLPSLPGVALEILELGKDPDTSLADLTKAISPDPVLSAKLLKAANSPLYAQRRKTDNLRQAVSLLGLNTALTLTLSFALKTSLGGTKTSFDTTLYWRRSVLTAIACRSLSEQCVIGSPEQLFLAGLLRDIGMLALDSALPDEYGDFVAAAMSPDGTGTQQLQAERLIAIERERLGTDHANVGAWLLRHWNLPDYLPMVVAGGQDPEVVDVPLDMRPFVHCVALGGRLADVWLQASDELISRQTAQLAEQWLGIDKQGYLGLLQTISAKLPEFSALFEMQLVDPLQTAGILSEAKEIFVLRNLQLVQEAAEAKHVAEVLESRARVLEEQNRLDALTGLCNRGGLDDALRKEFQRASEEGWPLSIAFVDLDYFKQINDSYGHVVGDQVLVSVAKLLADSIRNTDLVARYGGEEFVILLPGTGYKGANILAGRLVEKLRTQRHTTDTTQPIQVTASIGLATHMDDNQHFATVGDLLNAADQALYAAKHAGRDQVITYAALS
jgi:diguanylate cyclase (GGDEF)-like protein